MWMTVFILPCSRPTPECLSVGSMSIDAMTRDRGARRSLRSSRLIFLGGLLMGWFIERSDRQTIRRPLIRPSYGGRDHRIAGGLFSGKLVEDV